MSAKGANSDMMTTTQASVWIALTIHCQEQQPERGKQDHYNTKKQVFGVFAESRFDLDWK